MNKITTLLLVGMFGVTSAVSAQETETPDPVRIPSVVSTVPAQGIVSIAGSVSITFNMVPKPNLSCTTPALFFADGEVKGELYSNSRYVQLAVEGETDETVTLSFTTKPITAGGDYEIRIPKGFFTFTDDMLENEEISLHFNILSKISPVVSPKSGYFTEFPNLITVRFDGAQKIVANHLTANEENQGLIYFNTPDETIEPEVIVNGTTVLLNLPSNSYYTRRGSYSLELPEGAFTVTTDDGRELISSYASYDYYIPVIPYPHLDPAPGKVSSLSKVTMYFEEDEDCVFDRFQITPALKQVYANGTLSASIPFGLTIPAANVRGKRSLEFAYSSGAVTTPGKYKFMTSRSAFSATGMLDDDNPAVRTTAWANCAYEWDYEIVASLAAIESSYDVAVPVFNSIDDFVLNLPNAAGAEVTVENPDSATVRDFFDNPLNQYQVTMMLDPVSPQDEDSVPRLHVYVTPELATDGEYTLLIPAGAIKVGDSLSNLFFLDFKIDSSLSGAEVLEASEHPVDVYGIDGVRVAEKILPAEVGMLPAGLYIVGGRKVIVK